MDLKKIIIVCIALMILTPSFSVALEAEPSGSSSGSSSGNSAPASSPRDSNPTEKSGAMTENFETSNLLNLEENEEMNLDAFLNDENLEIDPLDETMSMNSITTPGPDGSLSSLTSIQSAELGFSNDAFLTSLFSGAAVYTYPIEVPKGIAGFQPKIELSYNSQSVGGVYGWLGNGWSLNEYYILRDVNFTPNDISDDRFVLIFDGQSHKLIYSETDGFYHTEIETYMKIQKVSGGSNQKGEYWTVTTKDGTLYRFGYTSDSELLNSVTGRDYVTKWKLDQIKDVNGNLIVYNYVKNPVAGEVGTSYLNNISYNNGFNVIEFERTNKPVTFNGYRDGSRVSEKCLLSAVSIKADGQLVYRYEIHYVSNNHVLLDSISLIGMDSTRLPATSFSYGSISSEFVSDPSWQIPPFIWNGKDTSVRFVDLNGDGLPDIVQSIGSQSPGINPTITSTKNVWINTGSGFVLDPSWSIPVHIIMNDRDNGVRLVDINGDGFTDIVQSNGSTQNVWINTGNDFVLDPSWSIPIPIWQHNVQIFDINGDGLPDIVRLQITDSPLPHNVWINTGSGFVLDSSWSTLPLLSTGVTPFQVADINGDGLPDILLPGVPNAVWINTGNDFVLDSSLSFPESIRGSGVRVIDINGDGLPDVVHSRPFEVDNSPFKRIWINTGNGFVLNSSIFFPVYISDYDRDQGVRFVDINGDGLTDIVQSLQSGSKKNTWINSPNSVPNLLTQVNHSSGAVTKIEYAPSTKYDNTDENGKHGLPTVIQVVKNVEIDNGMQNDQKTVSTLTYDYKGGFMHFEPKGNTEFRGFRQVTVTNGRTVTEHYFHQDKAKKGKEHLTITKSASDVLYSKTENNFIVNSAEDIFEVLLNNTSTFLYDGKTIPVVSKTNYEFDAYGNVISIFNEGDLSITGDENTILFEYTYNTNNWILNKVKKETIKDANLQKAAEAEFYYDGNSGLNAAPSKGLMTKIVSWNNGGDDIVKEFDYDSFGNLISRTDGNGHITTISYGTNPIFPISFTNALSQTTLLEHNLSTGKLEKITDPNGFETIMVYDGLRRITTVIKPGDTPFLPTIQYYYFIDGQAPEYIKISTKKQGNQYYDMWNYYDGLKRVIKTESDSDILSQKIITETYYDDYGGVSKIIAPRKGDEPALVTVNQYDMFGRVIQVTSPDGSFKQAEYNQLKIVSFDENGHKIQIDKDIHGNIVKVTEFNGNEIYETCYEYDALNQLIKIIPNQYYDQSNISFLVENSNVAAGSLENTLLLNLSLSTLGTATPIDTAYKVENTTFVYDSLGQQVMMDDPDLGVWTYAYTPNNKIASQTDARGVTIEYEYDALDRLILIRYPNDDDVVYEYDNGTIGTLSKVSSGVVTKSYSYDSRLRMVKEVVSIDGMETFGTYSGNLIEGEPLYVQSNTTRDETDLLNIEKTGSNMNPANAGFNQSLSQSFGQSLSQSFSQSSDTFDQSSNLQSDNKTAGFLEDKFSMIGSNDFIVDLPADELSIYNQMGAYELTGETLEGGFSSLSEMEKSLTEITMPNVIHSSSAPSWSNSGSFVNQQNIKFYLEEEGYRVQRVDLTNLRVSTGTGDIGYIYLNNHLILKFVHSGSGGNLYTYDQTGRQLGNIAKVNGKPSADNMTFDVSFILVGSDIVIEIQKYNRGVPNGTFRYSYLMNEDIMTLRAHLDGYQSNVDYISGQYTIKYEALPNMETITEGSFENQQGVTLRFI